MSSLPGIYAQLPDDVQSIILSNIVNAQQAEEHLMNGYLERQKAIDRFKWRVFHYHDSYTQHNSQYDSFAHQYCHICKKDVIMKNRTVRKRTRKRGGLKLYGRCPSFFGCGQIQLTKNLSKHYHCKDLRYFIDEDWLSCLSTEQIYEELTCFEKRYIK